MSKKLKANCKRILFTALVATFSLGAVAPINLKAEAISTNASAGMGSVKIKDTTITFNSVTEAAKGSIGFVINATLEKESGIPEEANSIYVIGKGKVTINGKQYEMQISGPGKFTKTSNTTAQIRLSAVPTSGKQPNVQVAKNVTPDVIKGNQVEITIKQVAYKKNIDAISEEFKELLKNVPVVKGVSIEQAGFGECKRWLKVKNTLPEKGLNIPIADGIGSVVDNIGFTDGKLQIRTKEKAGDLISLDYRDSNGKLQIDNDKEHVGENYIHVFNIKDAAALSKITLEICMMKGIACDQETQTVTCVF